MDSFLLILDAAKAVYLAADTAQGNRAQCALLKERVQRMLAELQRLPNGRREAFAASPTGCGLVATLESAAALCSEFGQKGWLARVFSADKHAAQFEEIQRRLDSVVGEASLSVALLADERRAAAKSDADDARKLIEAMQREQRAGFENVQAGQGERALGVGSPPWLAVNLG